MNLKNIALQQCGAEIIDKSSVTNDNLHPAINVLLNEEDLIWNSAQGLPQYLTISLQNVDLQYESICSLGFHCWHDYQSNPKTIQIQVASAPNDRFIFWTSLTLKQQSGKQFFRIKPIPSSYKIIKFLITETFGQFQTYLNQIFIYVNSDVHNQTNQNQSLNIQDLQSPKQTYGNKDQSENSEIYLPLKLDKPKKQQLYFKKPAINNNKPKQKFTFHENKSQSKEQSEMIHHPEIYKKHFSKPYEDRENHSDNQSSQQNNREEEENEEEEEEDDEKSLNKDLALLALSKNVMEMEENVENIKRELEVLNLKINMSFEKFESKLVNKIQQIVQSKMKKLKNELKSQLKRQQQELLMPKGHKIIKQEHFKSRQSLLNQSAEEYELIPPKKDKLSTKNNNSSKKIVKQQEKQVLVASLMNKLAKKLEQRELKMKKMEIKRSKEELSKRHTIHHM